MKVGVLKDPPPGNERIAKPMPPDSSELFFWKPCLLSSYALFAELSKKTECHNKSAHMPYAFNKRHLWKFIWLKVFSIMRIELRYTFHYTGPSFSVLLFLKLA